MQNISYVLRYVCSTEHLVNYSETPLKEHFWNTTWLVGRPEFIINTELSFAKAYQQNFYLQNTELQSVRVKTNP